jgi:hypothetical protein
MNIKNLSDKVESVRNTHAICVNAYINMESLRLHLSTYILFQGTNPSSVISAYEGYILVSASPVTNQNTKRQHR